MATVQREGVSVTDGAVHVTFGAGGSLPSGTTIPNPTFTGTASHTSTPIYHAYNVGAPGDTNYERAALWWTGNDYVIGLEQGGTGSAARQLHLRGGSSGSVRLMVGSTTLSIFSSTFTGIGNSSNTVMFGTANPSAGGVTTRAEINKAVTGIANNTATDVFTVTVPNAAHSAGIEVIMVGSLGAGGAIGANEATATTKYLISVARTAGANAVAVIGAADGSSGSAAVSGAATITVTADLGSVSGAAGATNTFTIRVTIARGSGSSTNHTVMAYARVLNANATGVTVA